MGAGRSWGIGPDWSEGVCVGSCLFRFAFGSFWAPGESKGKVCAALVNAQSMILMYQFKSTGDEDTPALGWGNLDKQSSFLDTFGSVWGGGWNVCGCVRELHDTQCSDASIILVVIDIIHDRIS